MMVCIESDKDVDLPVGMETATFEIKDGLNIHELYDCFDHIALLMGYQPETVKNVYRQ